MSQEIKTFQDVLRHVEAVTVVKLGNHVFSMPDSLVDGLNINQILIEPNIVYLADKNTARALMPLPRRLFDARGEEIRLSVDRIPVMNMFDNNGNLVLRREVVAKLENRLTITVDEFQSIRAFILAFVNNVIAEICCFPGSRGNPNDMMKLIREEYRDLDWLEALKGNLSMLREEISTVVRPHNWSYHYVRQLRDGSISIERGFDYRIVKYYEREFQVAEDASLN